MNEENANELAVKTAAWWDASCRGWYLYRFAEATQGRIKLTIEESGRHPESGRLLDYEEARSVNVRFAPLDGYQAHFSAREGDIPRVLSELLLQWSRELAALAATVLEVPAEPFESKPLAYVVVDGVEPNDILGARLTPMAAAEVIKGFLEMTHGDPRICVDAVENYPELTQQVLAMIEQVDDELEGLGEGPIDSPNL